MPLVALVISAVTNVVLDLVFVIYFAMGVRGVAWATVISQVFAAIFVFWVLMTVDAPYRVNLLKMKFYPNIFKRVFIIGLPSGLQMSITSFSNIFVQSYVNAFGSACMAGYTIYGKIDTFAFLPRNCINAAGATFAGQNVGAGKNDRVMQGMRTTQILSFIVTVMGMIPVLVFRRGLTAFFNTDPEVIRYGAIWLLTITPFYLLGCYTDPMVSVLRGAGETRAPMFIMLGSFVVFRQIYLFILTRLTDSFMVMAFAYPAGWVMSFLGTIFYFYKGHWRERCLVQPKSPPEPAEDTA
jgi:putative MATE family efflux protein